MKDKTLYWILGIIAAYFVIRFIMNQFTIENGRVVKRHKTDMYY